MQTYSAAFKDGITKNQQLFTAGYVTDSSGRAYGSFNIGSTSKAGGKGSTNAQAGSITVDATAAQRRSCSFTIPLTTDAELTKFIPQNDGNGLLSPFGNEVTIMQGLIYRDGSREMKQLGVFEISTVTLNDTGNAFEINVQGYDRSQIISRRQFTAPYPVAAGSLIATVIRDILTLTMPNIKLSMAPTGTVTPVMVFQEGGDPWASCQQLALAAGFMLYFDVFGVCQFQPIPNAQKISSTWTYSDGVDSMISELQRSFTNSGVANAVWVAGEGTGVAVPILELADDVNPNSVTDRNGPYGTVPLFIRESTITTSAQALSAAQNYLQNSLGGAETVTMKILPNPCQDVWDVITVNRTRANITNMNYVVQTIKFPLGAQQSMPMEMTARNVAYALTQNGA